MGRPGAWPNAIIVAGAGRGVLQRAPDDVLPEWSRRVQPDEGYIRSLVDLDVPHDRDLLEDVSDESGTRRAPRLLDDELDLAHELV